MRTVLMVLVCMGGVVHLSAQAQRGVQNTPFIHGRWFMNGDPTKPCEIRQDGNRALFINEFGSRARGTVRGSYVLIPDWSDGQGSDGLIGRVRGNRIVWPNGSFWSRLP